MSGLFDISDKLQDTEALIARLERELPNYRDRAPLLVNLQTLQNRRAKLEAEFLQTANELGIEVCEYKMIPTRARAIAAAVGNALVNYQAMVSIFFDAISSGRAKERGQIGADVASKTALEFEYAFTGSVGVALTIPREIWLAQESPLEETIRVISEVVHATKPDEILPHAQKLGRAPIRSVFKWADGHVKGLMGAEVLWRRGDAIHNRLLVQSVEFERLQRAISEMSEEEVSTTSLTGTLMAVDLLRKTFKFVPDEGNETILGSFTEEIDASHPALLPRRYTVRLKRTATINYATEDERVFYHLERLDPI